MTDENKIVITLTENANGTIDAVYDGTATADFLIKISHALSVVKCDILKRGLLAKEKDDEATQ
ncbi:hypothetical protein MmiEs2_08990 [Methanimicrococcus stummii]|uniref:Uncharacterized protein n=1 Tax=Methanimicrococcus stummii TaxID=3028294 RepID=A0AA96VI55_9EURY|nr:hypothetical protein [Methanimicrococcus sp. Es2]WNY28696.1 hypothetical protein MmiEs2_08990 [Methanimicrococcus sp. Es2]